MNEENDTGKHEFNFFLDKEIQQKLLEADEEIAAKEAALFKNQVANSKVQLTPNPSSSLVHSNSSNAAGTFKSSLSKPVKDSLRANISGWCSGPGVIYRKSESDLPLRSRGQQSLRDALPRDSKFRPQTHNPQDFVFRHYADPRRYIEQYRKEHSCYDTTTTSATRGEFLDTRRFYAYNQYSPLAVPTQNNAPPLNNPLPSPYQDLPQSTSEQTIYNQKKLLQQSQAPTLQYTNRREQTKQTISANLRPSNLQKFSRSNTTNLESKAKTSEHLQESNVTLDHEDHVKRVGSARGSASPGINGLSLQRNPTPSDLERLSARGQRTPSKGIPADSNSSNQFSGRKLGQVPSSHTRTLDALASQAPIGGKQISGDPPAASTSATTWPCPEDRLEQLRRVRRKHLAQPAAPAPQLTFIREGDELVQQVMGGRPSWPGSGANSKQDRAGTQTVRGLQGVEVVGAAVAVGAAADVGDGGVDDSGSSNFSSLQPNGGSSVRTSISSNSNSSYSKSKKHWKLIKGKPEDPANFRQGSERLMHEAVAHSKSPAYSTSSLPSTSVTNQLLADQSSSLSWRERVQQQQNALTSSGDAGADNQQITSGRWAVARRQEELSSIAHAQRIKHLIEQSRQQGGVDGTGLTLGRSVSEVDGRGKGRNSGGEGQETLRVEGQTHRNKTVHIPPATTISGLGNEKGASLEGSHGQRGNSFPSLHAVLPPVRKNRNDGDGGSPETQQKQRTQVNPVLGDLLDAQSFFSHCIPLDSIESTTGKHQQQQQQQHYHYHQHLQQRSVPGEKHQPAVAKPGSLSRSVGCVAATDTVSRITIATAAVVREPPQPRLKYSSTVHYKLTGGCLP